MRTVSEKAGLLRLAAIRERLRNSLAPFERRAKSCGTCETKGACCLDAHFVNVHVSRLEAAAIRKRLAELPAVQRNGVEARINAAIEDYGLSAEGDTFSSTYACPLFDRSAGCLVHEVKPLACIEHACYADPRDLPPGDLRESAEREVDDLNRKVYRKPVRWLPIPLAVSDRAELCDTE